MTAWITPQLQRRGTSTPAIADAMRDAEPWQIVAFVMLASGHSVRWIKGRKGLRPVWMKRGQPITEADPPPTAKRYMGNEVEFITMDEVEANQ